DQCAGRAATVTDGITNRGGAHEVGGWREDHVRARDAGCTVGRADTGDGQRIAIHVAVVDQRAGAAAVAVADAVANRGDAYEVDGRREHHIRARDAGRAAGRADAGDGQRVTVHVAVVDQRPDGDANVFHRVGEIIPSNRRIVGRAHRHRDQCAGRAATVTDGITNRGGAHEVGGWREDHVRARD